MSVKVLLLMLIFSTTAAMAQEIVRGEVKDKKSGEPVYNAVIKVDGIGKAKTDFEGIFSFKIAAGTYKLVVSNINEGYIDEEVELVVVAGNVTSINVQIGKDKSIQEFDAVKVVGVKSVGTPTTLEGSDLRRMDESAASDELPKETIRNSGVNNAADAVQMVPAASVEDGKNVYIRGLGDRYTKTILNGMDIPGLDPDRNSVQMDIFPAVLIDNITVYKTFTPNLTADFTGGLINIATKDFPGRKTIYAQASLGYNTRATFNSDFISYQGGKLDFLGFDDGTRALPISPTTIIPHPASGSAQTTANTAAFGQTMATQKALSFLNQTYSFAIGNQLNLNSKKDSSRMITYGYNGVLNYRNANTYFGDVEYNEYIRDTDSTETKLFRDRSSKGELAQNDVLWTALVGQSVKFGRNKVSLVLFRTQNATTSAAKLREVNFDSNQAILIKEGLQYTQRSISNANLSGLHYLDSTNKWKLNWNVSPTYSRISDPDIRSTAVEEQTLPNGDIQYVLNESVGAEIRRIFRSLNEYNVSAKIDIERKFMQWDSLESSFSFGLLNTYKNRTFDVHEYIFRLYNVSNIVPNDPNYFFESANLWTTETNQGTYGTGQLEKANIYAANANTSAAYVMNELPLSKKFEVTYGARVERNVNHYTGQSNSADYDPAAPRYVNEEVLNVINVLPSVNTVYKIRKDKDSLHADRSTNIRAAYTQTLARPSFREISISQIYDPIQGRRYSGNIDLKQTLIHNADLRWEHFFGRTELISASAFYKKFINPIEIVANVAAPNEFKPVNAGQADVYGAEFEIRKAIGFKTKEHIKYTIGTNFTYIVSRIDMNKVKTEVGGVEYTEKELRQAAARVGETVGDYRPMFGQSPFIVNAFMNYQDDSLRLMVNLTYNVQGKKLAVIGVGSLPDVYEQPFHSLNLKVSKKFGKVHKGESDPRWQASLTAQNLLNNARIRYYEAFGSSSHTYENSDDDNYFSFLNGRKNPNRPVFDYLHQGMTFSGSISFLIQ